MKRTRTLIVDDHAPFRRAVENWLKELSGVEVAGSCATDCKALPPSAVQGVDLLLVGLGWENQRDLELAKRLKDELRARKLVLMSLFPVATEAATAFSGVADGLVSKTEIFHQLPELLAEFFDAGYRAREGTGQAKADGCVNGGGNTLAQGHAPVPAIPFIGSLKSPVSPARSSSLAGGPATAHDLIPPKKLLRFL